MKHDSPGIRDIILVMGMTGWGKSWWTKLYSKPQKRILVYDPTMTFPVHDYLPIADIIERVQESESETHKTGCNFNFGFVDPEELPSAAGLCYLTEHNLLVVEECATVFDKGLARLPEWGRRHCFTGRHQSCSILLVAQRPTYIPIDFRSQANRVITFCQHEGTDMDWLQDFFGGERMDKMLSLPKFTCFDWHNGQVSEYSIAPRVKEEFGVSLDIRSGSELPSYV